jgi:hypothetical protein
MQRSWCCKGMVAALLPPSVMLPHANCTQVLQQLLVAR